MRNTRIVSHEDPRPPQPARQFVQILHPDRAFQLFLWPTKPVHRHFPRKPRGDPFEYGHRRALRRIAGKGMDSRESPSNRRASNFGESRSGSSPEFPGLPEIELDRMSGARGQRGQKLKRQLQVSHEFAELRPVRAIPGNHRVEAAQALDRVVRRQQAHAIEPRCNNGLRRIREASQCYILARAPDFGAFRSQRFQRGQAHDEIANGARPDQKATNQKLSQMNHQL